MTSRDVTPPDTRVSCAGLEALPPYPVSDERTIGYSLAKAAVGSVPGVGNAAQELMDRLVGDPLRRRQDKWLQELGLALQNLSRQLPSVNVGALENDEVFLSVVARATHQAVLTHSELKRQRLRNVVLNLAAGVRFEEALLDSFMSYVERFSDAHIKLLAMLDNPESALGFVERAERLHSGSLYGLLVQLYPDLATPEGLLDRIFEDIHREGLVDGSLRGMVTAHDLLSPKSTQMGNALLRFVRAP